MNLTLNRGHDTWHDLYLSINVHILTTGYKFDDKYGIEWIFFPDGDGFPHFVNLTEEDPKLTFKMRSLYRSMNEIEYRLYTRYE